MTPQAAQPKAHPAQKPLMWLAAALFAAGIGLLLFWVNMAAGKLALL